MLGIFGKDNTERKIVYRDGQYYFTDTGEAVPERLQRNAAFKKRGTVATSFDMTGTEELKKQVLAELIAGNLKKPVEATTPN